jgi:hypothetical protein
MRYGREGFLAASRCMALKTPHGDDVLLRQDEHCLVRLMLFPSSRQPQLRLEVTDTPIVYQMNILVLV